MERLRVGDDGVFATLARRYHGSLVRLAAVYAPTQEAAEEIARDTWLGLASGLDRVGRRTSVRARLFHALVARARLGYDGDRRISPLPDEPAVDPDRFGADGTWQRPPARRRAGVEHRSDGELLARTRTALDRLPEGQRQVVLLRDVEGLSARETCAVLGVSDGTQRALLHRGRERICASLETEGTTGCPA